MKSTLRSTLFTIFAAVLLTALNGCVMVNRPGKPSIETLDKSLSKASQGDAQSAYQTALSFSQPWNQRGLGQDPDAALRYLTDAAEGGYGPAQVYLARLYRDGHLGINNAEQPLKIKPDLMLAAYWLHRAAELSQRDAFNQLTQLYENPAYPLADPVEACKWALIAYAQSTYCTLKKLSPNQLAAARQKVADWQLQHPAKSRSSQP